MQRLRSLKSLNKTRVVVFGQNNARILVNPHNLAELSAQKNVYVDPDFNLCIGTEPHFWKVLENQEIITLGEAIEIMGRVDKNVFWKRDVSGNIPLEEAFYRSLHTHIKTRVDLLINPLKLRWWQKMMLMKQKAHDLSSPIRKPEIISDIYKDYWALCKRAANKDLVKEIFETKIKQFTKCCIIPMTPHECELRLSELKALESTEVLTIFSRLPAKPQPLTLWQRIKRWVTFRLFSNKL